MNIITIIQAALTALNNDAELFLLEKSRAENEELEHTTDTIVVYPDWRTTSIFTQSMEINKTRIYNIDFKTLDEWDNSDNVAANAYDSETTVNKIENMSVLANSIFHYINLNNNLFPEIIEKLRFTEPRPILRANNGTMSGVTVQLTVIFKGTIICDYT